MESARNVSACEGGRGRLDEVRVCDQYDGLEEAPEGHCTRSSAAREEWST